MTLGIRTNFIASQIALRILAKTFKWRGHEKLGHCMYITMGVRTNYIASQIVLRMLAKTLKWIFKALETDF